MVVGGREARVITALVPPGTMRAGGTLLLPESEAHHLRVRRVSIGTALRLQDGAGGSADAVLVSTTGGSQVRVDAVTNHPAPTVLRLVVGAGDRERFEWLAEKAAELGVTELIPLVTRWSESVASRVRPSHLERIARLALEATKQSGAPWAPVVGDLTTVEQACRRYPEGVRWLADAAGDAPTPRVGLAKTVVVGPEGGLAAAEREEFVAAGFAPVRLGPHVLRFETAAVVAAALVRSAEGIPE